MITGQASKSASQVAGRAPQRINRLAYLLMTGHICVDMVQGGISAVIPFLVLHSGFSYAQAAMLVFAANISSAVIQPVFGVLGDRTARPWLLAAGVALAGLGMAGIGLFSSYWLVVCSSLVSGVGIAMLHPEGGRLAYLVGGDRKAESMSVFSVGGQIGFCAGPVATVAFVSLLGLKGLALFLVISLPVACVLLSFNGRFLSYGLREPLADSSAPARDRWGMFSFVLGACSVRSVVFYGITSFVPLLLVSNFGIAEEMASSTITVFAAVGAVATLASGHVVRHVRTTKLMVCCFAALAVVLAAFILSSSLVLSVLLVMLLAVGLNLFNPPAVALGQTYLPMHLGTASGLTFGVAVAVGGVASPALGTVGDAIGLEPIMWILFAVALVGLAVSAILAHLASRDDAGMGEGRKATMGTEASHRLRGLR